MNPENDNKYMRIKKITLVVAGLILAAGLLGWWLGHSDTSPNTNQTTSNSSQSDNEAQPSSTANGPDVKSLVSYTLPDGWKEFSCPTAVGAVFIVPSGAGSVDCNANPSAPVKISVDPGNSKDCNDIQNVQNVSKHVCVSEYINGHKSLKAETIYNQESSYKKTTTVAAYYIDTGKGVVKVEYVHESDNDYQTGFDQLAHSIQVK